MSVFMRGQRFGRGGGFGARHPMTDDEIFRVAPSVFATERHESRSERFTYIPTFEVLAGLRKEGFEVVNAVQGNSRVEGKAEFTKHMLRLRHPDFASRNELGGLAPEGILLNAHDGTSSYRLMSGVLRSICLNSMICWEDGAKDLRVPHKGDIVSKVIEGTFEVIGDSTRALDTADTWNGLMLDHDEQRILAEAVHTVRFADAEGSVTTPITPAQLLQPRRTADVGNSLWLTMNRVQENVARGGLHGVARGEDGRRRNVTTRPVQSIEGDVKLNRAIWQLTSEMAKLKGTNAA